MTKTYVKINSFTQARLIKLLFPGIYSCEELAAETGLSLGSVRQYVRELHKVGAVYIDHWEKDALDRDAIRIFKLGEGKDAKRKSLTPYETQIRYRQRKKMQALINMTAGVHTHDMA